MTLPQYMFRDPSKVLEEKQERELRRSCDGCKFHKTAWGVEYCDRDRKRSGAQLKRCKHYESEE